MEDIAISWLVNAGIGYDFVQSDKAVVGLIGGVRYLSLDVDKVMNSLQLSGPALGVGFRF